MAIPGNTWQYNQEAVAAGLYKSELRGISYPRLQIRMVEELLAGKSFEYPQREAATWKQAARGREEYSAGDGFGLSLPATRVLTTFAKTNFVLEESLISGGYARSLNVV